MKSILQLKVVMEALCRYFERELSTVSNHNTLVIHPARLYMQNLQNKIESRLDGYSILKEQAFLGRDTVRRILLV